LEVIILNTDWKNNPIESAEQGKNPTFLKRMKSGIVLFGYSQFLPGYCLLIATPEVPSLNHLDISKRQEFMLDMSILGDAILKTCNPLRVNYSMYGNSSEFLHTHIFPRYDWEPEEYRQGPVWLYPKSKWTEEDSQWTNPKYKELMVGITKNLDDLMKAHY
jgi:diadenosine tetraphosphate (Ap4A) HIT family hydrolase